MVRASSSASAGRSPSSASSFFTRAVGGGAATSRKRAADAAGKPIYLELSSINPVVILPGALSERGSEIAEEFSTSCLMGTGQFCTNPGLVLLLADAASDRFLQQTAASFQAAAVGTLLSRAVQEGMERNTKLLCAAGAQLLAGGTVEEGSGYRFENTLLRVAGDESRRPLSRHRSPRIHRCRRLPRCPPPPSADSPCCQCYDNVREHRLPAELRDANLADGMWRWIDGDWTRENV